MLKTHQAGEHEYSAQDKYFLKERIELSHRISMKYPNDPQLVSN